MLAQIREIDSQLAYAVEAYNLATIKLDKIDADLRCEQRTDIVLPDPGGRDRRADRDDARRHGAT